MGVGGQPGAGGLEAFGVGDICGDSEGFDEEAVDLVAQIVQGGEEFAFFGQREEGRGGAPCLLELFVHGPCHRQER